MTRAWIELTLTISLTDEVLADVEVRYRRGTSATYYSPAEDDELEIDKIEVYGDTSTVVKLDLTEYFLNTQDFEERWRDILLEMAAEEADYDTDPEDL